MGPLERPWRAAAAVAGPSRAGRDWLASQRSRHTAGLHGAQGVEEQRKDTALSADDGLRAILKRHLTPLGFELSAVESGGTVSGLPDVHWIHREARAAGWVECKATTGWSVKMRPHQCGWLRRATDAGVRGVVAVRARGAGSAAGRGDALWLVQGRAAATLADVGLGALPADALLGRWLGAPQGWDWPEISRLLLAEQ